MKSPCLQLYLQVSGTGTVNYDKGVRHRRRLGYRTEHCAGRYT